MPAVPGGEHQPFFVRGGVNLKGQVHEQRNIGAVRLVGSLVFLGNLNGSVGGQGSAVDPLQFGTLSRRGKTKIYHW